MHLLILVLLQKNTSNDLELQHINFSQFTECIGRCALLLFPSGSLPSETLKANKAAVHFQGESAKSVNYVQRYLSRTNHFRAIEYSPRRKRVNSHKKCALPRMPTQPAPSRSNRSKRRIRIVSQKKDARKDGKQDQPHTEMFSNVHISADKSKPKFPDMQLPAI